MSNTESQQKNFVLNVAVCQVHSHPGSLMNNLNIIQKAVQTTKLNKPQTNLILFPEMFITGYDIDSSLVHSLALDLNDQENKIINELKQIAKLNKIALVVPYPQLVNNQNNLNNELKAFDDKKENKGNVFNSCLVISELGNVIFNYQKTHLWHTQEKNTYSPGNEPYKTFLLEPFNIKCGILICYDIEFPEPARIMGLQECQVLFVPTALSSSDSITPIHTIFTRAFENHMFLLYSNLYGRSSESSTFIMCGLSAIIGPDGHALARAKGILDPFPNSSKIFANHSSLNHDKSNNNINSGEEASLVVEPSSDHEKIVAGGKLEFMELLYATLDSSKYRFETTPYYSDRRKELFKTLI